MPLDVITINALVQELSASIVGKKILKIRQTSANELNFELRSPAIDKFLVLSMHPSLPAVYLTDEKKESPLDAYSFCMLARKHLSGGVITDICLINCDRVIKITVNSRNELNDNVNYFLIAELTGRRCNLIITTSDMVIIDALRRTSLDTSRVLYPKAKYTLLPPDNKVMLNSDLLYDTVKVIVDESTLLEKTSGLSKATAREIIHMFPENIFEGIKYFLNIFSSAAYSPCVLMDTRPKDFFVTRYLTVEGDYRQFPSLNVAISYFCRHQNADKLKTNKELSARVKKAIKKIDLRIADREKVLNENPEKYKVMGEMILNNLWRIKKSEEKLVCENFYTSKTEEISLDPLLTPNQNAASYFKKYTKLKRGMEYATQQVEELHSQKDYLMSVKASLDNASSPVEFLEIKEELDKLEGRNKQSKANGKKQKNKSAIPSKPIHIEVKGYSIFCGKNSRQNQTVTFEIASSNDVWLHAKNYHGSHVIIKGENPPDDVIAEAASFASYFSDAKTLPKAEVDYTLRKYVKKLKMPGMVTYKNHNTIVVVPKNPIMES